jgi:hypothetical protein
MHIKRLKRICSRVPARGVERSAARMFILAATRKEKTTKRMHSSAAWQRRIRSLNM